MTSGAPPVYTDGVLAFIWKHSLEALGTPIVVLALLPFLLRGWSH